MASSLLFRIKSVFESQGFDQAKSGFTAVLGTVGKLTAAAAVLVTNFGNVGGAMSVLNARGASFLGTAAKLVFSFRALGVAAAFFALDAGKAIVKTIIASVPAAARAEVSFTRLRNQLDLLGKGSEKNIKRIQQFTEGVATSTQFSSEAAQEAVTIALRRTGSVEKAIKQVSVAQDIAAATGRDLVTVTNLLNVAQAGNTRFIRQITNLRQADIEAATRQGRLIDLLADKFGGSAARSTSTLAAKTQILANTQAQLREEIGKIGLPFAKFIKDVEILGARIALFGVKGATGFKGFIQAGAGLSEFFRENTTFSSRFFGNLLTGQNAVVAFATALKQSSDDTKRFNDELSRGSTATFNFDKELEVQTLRLGKTIDERRDLARQLIRVEDILRIAQSAGTDALTKEQTDLVNTFQFSSRQLSQILRGQTDELKTQFEKQQEVAAQRRATGARKSGGVFFSPGEVQQFVQNAQKAGASIEEIGKGLSDITGISRSSATVIAQSISSIGTAGTIAQEQVKNLLSTLSGLGTVASVAGTLDAVVQETEKQIQAKVQPKFNVNIDFQFPVEALQSAVIGAVNQLIPGIIARITNSARNASREARANSSAV